MARNKNGNDNGGSEDTSTKVPSPMVELVKKADALMPSPKAKTPVPVLPANVQTVSSAQKARPMRRSMSTGEVPLRTFVRAVAVKDDQLAGFVHWCSKNKLEKNTMAAWKLVLDEYNVRPVASAQS